MRIKEAIAYALIKGKKITNMDIAKTLWPDSMESTQRVNISKLLNGKTVTFRLDWIKAVCEMTGVDANFLLGIKKIKDETL